MAKNITLLGASYSDVPGVTLPKTGGGTATFYDVDDTTVAAGDVRSGKYFYTANGTKTQGNIANGTITNNTSGGTSSGTVNRGSQIKIGAGYYASDSYYTAQANSGTIDITGFGTVSVDGYANASVPEVAFAINVSATSSTSTTINDSRITTNTYVYNSANTDAGSDLSWSTSAGSITLSCSSGIPAMKLMLCRIV